MSSRPNPSTRASMMPPVDSSTSPQGVRRLPDGTWNSRCLSLEPLEVAAPSNSAPTQSRDDVRRRASYGFDKARSSVPLVVLAWYRQMGMALDLFARPLGSAPSDPDVVVGVSPVPPGAFAYRGQWVAIRGDKVVAARRRLRDLYQTSEVKDTDVTYHVPARPTVAF
jgi:hypothetical protein